MTEFTELYQVSNDGTVLVPDETWHEVPVTLDTFTDIPDGSTPEFRSTASGLPLRSMSVEEAVAVIPVIAVLLNRGRASVRSVRAGVQVSLIDGRRYNRGMHLAASTRRQFQKTFTTADWHLIENFLADPSIAAIVDKLPANLNHLDYVVQQYQDMIESGIRALYQ